MKLYHVLCTDDNGEDTTIEKIFYKREDAESFLRIKYLECRYSIYEDEENECDICEKEITLPFDVNVLCKCSRAYSYAIICKECIPKCGKCKEIDFDKPIRDNYVQNNAGKYWIECHTVL